MSRLSILTQPPDLRWLTVHGLLVPCIPYFPQGTSSPIHLVPNPPAHAALSATLNCPTGVGVAGFPIPMRYCLRGSPSSSNVMVKLDVSIRRARQPGGNPPPGRPFCSLSSLDGEDFDSDFAWSLDAVPYGSPGAFAMGIRSPLGPSEAAIMDSHAFPSVVHTAVSTTPSSGSPTLA